MHLLILQIKKKFKIKIKFNSYKAVVKSREEAEMIDLLVGKLAITM